MEEESKWETIFRTHSQPLCNQHRQFVCQSVGYKSSHTFFFDFYCCRRRAVYKRVCESVSGKGEHSGQKSLFFPNPKNPKLLFLPYFSRRFLHGRLRGRTTSAQYEVESRKK